MHLFTDSNHGVVWSNLIEGAKKMKKNTYNNVTNWTFPLFIGLYVTVVNAVGLGALFVLLAVLAAGATVIGLKSLKEDDNPTAIQND